MSRNVSIAQLGAAAQRQVVEKLDLQRAQAVLREWTADQAAKPAKYRNKKTEYTSIQGFTRVYDSKREARYAAELDAEIDAGICQWWLPQVRIPLPGGVTYVADFLVRRCTGVTFVDVKGKDTQASINKRKQAKALFGITVEVVK